MSELQNELDRFNKWFKENYPELFDKYGRNITIPFQEGGGVGVNTDYKISHEEHKMLTDIAHKYYQSEE